ncbi:hypothetical protein [Streptomyces hebeiensis]
MASSDKHEAIDQELAVEADRIATQIENGAITTPDSLRAELETSVMEARYRAS